MTNVSRLAAVMAMMAASALLAAPGDWTAPLEVRQEENLVMTYQAKIDAGYLVLRATIAPGWHTFAMDNKVRAEEKLAGKQSLGIDRPTEVTLSGGLQTTGPWLQSAPKDFSRPDLRWFSWGFERQAWFAAKLKRTGQEPVQITVKGQACTETLCKNIDVSFALPPAPVATDAEPTEIKLSSLVQVR